MMPNPPDLPAWLDRVEAYCKAATPGRWSYFTYRAVPFDNDAAMDWQCEHVKNWNEGTDLPLCNCANPYEVEGASIRGPEYIADPEQTIFTPEDANFCSKARTDLPLAITVIREFMAREARLLRLIEDAKREVKRLHPVRTFIL